MDMPSELNDEAKVGKGQGEKGSDSSNVQEIPASDKSLQSADGAFEAGLLSDVEFLDNLPSVDADWLDLRPRLKPDEDLPEMEIVIRNIWDD
jgi:hypothetical protein